MPEGPTARSSCHGAPVSAGGGAPTVRRLRGARRPDRFLDGEGEPLLRWNHPCSESYVRGKVRQGGDLQDLGEGILRSCPVRGRANDDRDALVARTSSPRSQDGRSIGEALGQLADRPEQPVGGIDDHGLGHIVGHGSRCARAGSWRQRLVSPSRPASGHLEPVLSGLGCRGPDSMSQP